MGIEYETLAAANKYTEDTIIGQGAIKGDKGDPGPKGDPGEGVAAGGTTGQVLVKSSDADYETEWGTVEGGNSQVSEMPTPSADNVGKIVQYVGETTYQYLNGEFYKCVNADGSYKWEVVNEEELLTIHSLLTETNPLTVYGNTNSNENVWISSEAFVPKGSIGHLRVLGGEAGTSYKVMLLRKNSDTNFTILETLNHTQSVAKEITEFVADGTNESIYIGLYSNNGGFYYSITAVTSKDYILKNTLAAFNAGDGTADVTKASARINFSYALIVETTPIKGSVYYPFVVDASGHGDFVSIGDAIDNTSEDDVIYIRSGIYKEKVSMWGKNRHLLGESKLTTFLVSDARLYGNEPLKANMGVIEGLTIIGGYGLTPVYDETTASYAIHVEYANATPFELLIKDCNIISNVAAAIGLGVRHNQKVTIQDCYIETKVEKMWSSVSSQYFDCGAIFCHNDATSPNLGTDAYLSVENCELKGVKTAITLNSQNNGNTLTFRFLHNTLWSTTNGTENAVTIRATPTSGHLVGSDGVLNEISYGNNIDLLNATVVLPITPTTDGTYTLQATVTDGAVTYSWV